MLAKIHIYSLGGGKFDVRIFRPILGLILAGLAAVAINAQWNQQDLTEPDGSVAFGTHVLVMANGNYFIADPAYDPGGIPLAGAVFLYDGTTHQIISVLTGSNPGDMVGSRGLVEMVGTDNVLVLSPEWNNTAGAVTRMVNAAGTAFYVDTDNSLTGHIPGTRVGSGPLVRTTTGHYVVGTPTWTDGSAPNMGAATLFKIDGTFGYIDDGNSLLGTLAEDKVGQSITPLNGGHYVVGSPNWSSPWTPSVGAATWANGNGSTVGYVSAENSLVGTRTGDRVGSKIVALTNGHYVVASINWANGPLTGAGAVTWCNGATGATVGEITPDNSLVGSTAYDRVGTTVLVLKYGNYAVISPNWDDRDRNRVDVGAVTWGDGVEGSVTGPIEIGNSMLGLHPGDKIGNGSYTLFTNGHFAYGSPNWHKERGAVTWGGGNGELRSGYVSEENSLVGSTAKDRVGTAKIRALPNGNYAFASPDWDLPGAKIDVGAVTFADGYAMSAGPVSTSNSIIGATDGDRVGSGELLALQDNSLVISSPSWRRPIGRSGVDVGAVTWVAAGVTSGVVTAANSLTGDRPGDRVGFGGLQFAGNGNYLVSSPYWRSNGVNAQGQGAITWGNGSTGTVGIVSRSNSMVGSQAGDRVGIGDGISVQQPYRFVSTTLYDGSVVVASPYWRSAGVDTNGLGAATWMSGNQPTTGSVGQTNSLIGSTVGDRVGYTGVGSIQPIFRFLNGSYCVYTPFWDRGNIVDAGALTMGKTGGENGFITHLNSVVGAVPGQPTVGGVLVKHYRNLPDQKVVVGLPFENKVTFIGP